MQTKRSVSCNGFVFPRQAQDKRFVLKRNRFAWVGRSWTCKENLPCSQRSDRVLYGAGPVGVLGAVVSTTNESTVLRIDVQATDVYTGDPESSISTGRRVPHAMPLFPYRNFPLRYSTHYI